MEVEEVDGVVDAVVVVVDEVEVVEEEGQLEEMLLAIVDHAIDLNQRL